MLYGAKDIVSCQDGQTLAIQQRNAIYLTDS
jgi:hypothetical protein